MILDSPSVVTTGPPPSTSLWTRAVVAAPGVAPGGDPVIDERPSSDRPPELSRRAVVGAVARRGGPKLLEATVIPAGVFYLSLVLGGLAVAYIAALCWIYSCLVWRLVRRRAVSPFLVLAVIALTVRTVVAIGSGSTFMYFLQPILGTLVIGAVFLGSLLWGRPLIARMAGDFWPISPKMAANPGVRSLFRRLTALWAIVNLTTAATSFVLLLFLPLATFVAVKQASALGITVIGVILTVLLSHRTACREGYLRAPKDKLALMRP